MKTAFYIIVDVSGSMNEMGKIHLQRNLCRYAAQIQGIDQEKYADLEIRFYQWAQDISEIAIQSDGDIPLLNTEDSSSLNVLSDFLSKILNATRKPIVLILSDGNVPNSDISGFQKRLSSLSDLIIGTVAVGADADLLKLKKISTNNRVHLSENISSAIDSALFSIDVHLTAATSTAQIMQSEPIKSEEDWDA
jgi:hypothetical protein